MLGFYDLTIITPLYNRRVLINRLAVKLNELEINNATVEWVIIDDGSDDSPFDGFLVPTNIKTTIIRKDNGGKHTAINAALETIKSDFVLFLDSDDYITQHQINNIIKAINDLPSMFDGAIGYNIRGNGKPIGCLVDNFKKNDIFKIKGDYSRVVRTELVISNRFDVFESEKFNTEMNYWCKIHSSSKFKSFQSDFVTVEYQMDGLSSKYQYLCNSNPKGIMSTIEAIFSNGYKFRYTWKFCLYHLSCLSNPIRLIMKSRNLLFNQKLVLISLILSYKSYLRVRDTMMFL